MWAAVNDLPNVVDSEESSDERLNRELIELLNEIRVLLPGVQILLAFLLTVPFTEQFDRINDEQRWAYIVTFASAALATVLLIAPTAYHRVQFRQRDKERLLRWSNRLSIVGTVCIGIGMAASGYLVFDFVFATPAAIGAAVAVTVLAALTWIVLPLSGRSRGDDGPEVGARP